MFSDLFSISFLGVKLFIYEPIFKFFVALFKTFKMQKDDNYILFVCGYGKPFYYLLGNVDILFIYKISYKVYKISNIYQISYILY